MFNERFQPQRPCQLVLNELDEKTACQAQVQAARNKQSLVSHLVRPAGAEPGVGRGGRRVWHRLLRPEQPGSEAFRRMVISAWSPAPRVAAVETRQQTVHRSPTRPTIRRHRYPVRTGLTTEALLVGTISSRSHRSFTRGAMDALGDPAISIDGVDVGKAESASQDERRCETPPWCASSRVLLDAIRAFSDPTLRKDLSGALPYRWHAPRSGQTADPVGSRISARLQGNGRPGSPNDANRRTDGSDVRIEEQRSTSRHHLCRPVGREDRMRILDSSSAQMGIDAHWATEEDQRTLPGRVKRQGMILVTGPWLGQDFAVHRFEHPQYHRHQHLHRRRPVEINLEGINQVSVNPRQGMDFSPGAAPSCARTRRIMVGESAIWRLRDRHQGGADRAYGMSTCTPTAPPRPDPPAEHGRAGVQPATSVNLIIAQRLRETLFALQERTTCRKPCFTKVSPKS